VEEKECWCRHGDGRSATALDGGGDWAWRSLDAVRAATVLSRGYCACRDRASQSVGSVPQPGVGGSAARVPGTPCSPRLTPGTCGTPIKARREGRGVRFEITRRPRPCEPVQYRIRAGPRSGRGVEGAASDLRSPVGRGPGNWKLCNLQQYCKSMHRQFHM